MAKKAVFLMRDFRMGGGEKSTVSLMNYLVQSCFDISVIVLNDAGPFKGELATGIRLHSLHTSQGSAILFLPRLIGTGRKLKSLLKQIRPDVVVGTSWFLNLTAASIIRDIHLMGARFLLINHNPVRDLVLRSTCFSLLAPVKRLITGRLFGRADMVVAITDVMRDDLRKFLNLQDSNMVVIRNGISCELTQSRAKEDAEISGLQTPYLVYVGRLEHEKGVDLLIDAFEKVACQLPHCLLIVGDGSQRADLEQMVKRAHLPGRVYFTGELTNPYPAMKRADFIVLPSRWDAFPYVLLESLALELPIISTDCEGPVKILDNGEYGVIVKKGEVANLAAAIVHFATNDSLRNSFRSKSFTRAMEFSSDRMMTQYESLFARL